MILLLLKLLPAREALAWSLINPESEAIKTGVLKPNAVIELVINATTYVFGIIGAAALLVFIIGGVMWLISAGRSQLVDKGRQAMVGAAIGMGVVFISYTATDFVLKTLGYANYAEWSTLPEQAEPRGKEISTPTGVPTKPSVITPSEPGVLADQNAEIWDKYRYDSSLIKNQKAEASESVQKLLECMIDKMPDGVGKISSISDEEGIVNCRTAYSRPPCAHEKNSCHYGGDTYAYSHAVDFGDEWNEDAIEVAANACGGVVKKESTHTHVSTSQCRSGY